MNFLDSLNARERAIVEQRLEQRYFAEGECMIRQGSPGNGCYIIDKGRARVELDTGETNTDVVLNYVDTGSIIGEFTLINEEPRSANVYAHTEVDARWLSSSHFREICQQNPVIESDILKFFFKNLINIVQDKNRQLAGYASTTKTPLDIDDQIARSMGAQEEWSTWPEDRVDAVLEDLAYGIASDAEILARTAVEETRMGVVEDKIAKIQFAGLDVFKQLKNRPAAGLLQVDDDLKVMEIASPMGVILGLVPLTNPVSTIIFKTLVSLKSRNAVIFSCHRNAIKTADKTCEIIRSILQKHKAPPDLVQWIRERSSRKTTELYMRHPNISFILATGGPSMVRAAYSSGTPAIGVGPGNAPVWVCSDADLIETARQVVASKSFDNGIICGSENNLVVDAAVRDAFVQALSEEGAAILDPEEAERLFQCVIDHEHGGLKREVIGQSAEFLSRQASIKRDTPIRLLVVPLDKGELDSPFAREKLAPILSFFTVHSRDEAMTLCKEILSRQGIGHTAIIHTKDSDLFLQYGLEMPASRILVNSPGSQGCIGLCNGLKPSLTLGCGTYGGSSTTDNVGFENLRNIKRIALAL